MSSEGPDASLSAAKGGPGAWLGFQRYEADFTPSPEELKAPAFRGALRGVAGLCLDRLQRAALLTATPVGPGQYHVTGPEDPEGEYVDLVSKDIERCNCPDFVFRSEKLKTPCKHMLAALLADRHPDVVAALARLRFRETLAKALKAPVTL